MVGWLIEQQHIRTPKQNLGKLYAHAPATGKFRCGTVEIGTQEPKADKGLFHFGFEVFALFHCKPVIEICHSFYQFLICVRFIIGAGCELMVYFIKTCFHVIDMAERTSHFIDDG